MMREALEYMVKCLVDNKDVVRVEEKDSGDFIAFKIYVAPGEVGQVMGRRTETLNAIRRWAYASAGAAGGIKITLEVLETEENHIEE